jgi:CheY-like chemotaxis protein
MRSWLRRYWKSPARAWSARRTAPRPPPECAASPPIIALTATAFAEDRPAYLEAGLDDYLAKPFDKADLAALFARWRNLGCQPEKRAGGAA